MCHNTAHAAPTSNGNQLLSFSQTHDTIWTFHQEGFFKETEDSQNSRGKEGPSLFLSTSSSCSNFFSINTFMQHNKLKNHSHKHSDISLHLYMRDDYHEFVIASTRWYLSPWEIDFWWRCNVNLLDELIIWFTIDFVTAV